MDKVDIDLLKPIFDMYGYDIRSLPLLFNAADIVQSVYPVGLRVTEPELCSAIMSLLVRVSKKPEIIQNSKEAKSFSGLLENLFLEIKPQGLGSFTSLCKLREVGGLKHVEALHLLLKTVEITK